MDSCLFMKLEGSYKILVYFGKFDESYMLLLSHETEGILQDSYATKLEGFYRNPMQV